jgi:preprotein translocase subunit SecE
MTGGDLVGHCQEEGLMATRTKSKGKASEREAPSRFGSLKQLVRDTKNEIKKVTWPDRETTRNLTIVVIALAAFLGAVLGGVDALFVRLWEMLRAF